MEMSALAAKNVVNLAMEYWEERANLADYGEEGLQEEHVKPDVNNNEKDELWTDEGKLNYAYILPKK